VKQIEKQKGVFLIGLKENQKELLTEMKFIASPKSRKLSYKTL